MKPRHPKYHIKKEDSLDTITNKFAVEESKWKQYHNNSCRLSDIIRTEIPPHLEEIFLLPELWDRENELNLKSSIKENPTPNEPHRVIFGYNNTLPLRKANLSKIMGLALQIRKVMKPTPLNTKSVCTGVQMTMIILLK